MSKELTQDDVWAMIKRQPIAMLATLDGERIVSRPMAGYVDREANRIRFLTRLDSGKAEEIGAASQVNLGYSEPKDGSYVSISGTARTSQDRPKIKEMWSPQAEAWMPEGPDAPTTALISVDPEEAVVWDTTSSRIVYAAKMLAAVITQSPPSAGKVEHVTL